MSLAFVELGILVLSVNLFSLLALVLDLLQLVSEGAVERLFGSRWGLEENLVRQLLAGGGRQEGVGEEGGLEVVVVGGEDLLHEEQVAAEVDGQEND